MRRDPCSSALPVPPPTPLLIALVAIAFVSCELARGTAAAAPAPSPCEVRARCDGAPCGRPCGDRAPTPVAAPVTDRVAVPVSPVGAEVDDSTVDDGEVGDVDPPARLRGPAIAAVLKAAYRAAGLDRDPSRGWIRRARLAGLIPWLTVRTGRDASWQSDEVSVDHGMAVDIRATWRLDRLAFDGRELQVASIESARRRERRRLASRVIRTYFTWQRASARAGRVAGTRSRALEAAAELDALTDGWFSESLAGSRRTASGFRTP